MIMARNMLGAAAVVKPERPVDPKPDRRIAGIIRRIGGGWMPGKCA
jgi:hypothetical protein